MEPFPSLSFRMSSALNSPRFIDIPGISMLFLIFIYLHFLTPVIWSVNRSVWALHFYYKITVKVSQQKNSVLFGAKKMIGCRESAGTMLSYKKKVRRC